MSLGMQLDYHIHKNPFNIMKQGGVVHNSNSNQKELSCCSNKIIQIIILLSIYI